MANITVTNDRYTAESVYQWDINQTLVIYGLSLAKVPEIHFSNLGMDRAVVRQATMDEKGVISVDIPNAMLQKPLEIVVHICMYEGDTFETLYKMSIPVKARKKPADYTIEDDEDIYSFNALENLVTNALIRVDTELSEAKTTLATAEKRYNDTVATITDIVDDSVDTAVGNLLDTTLSVEGKAGESKAVGKAIENAKTELKKYQKPWNIDENVASIVNNVESFTISYDASENLTSAYNSVSVTMINSGRLYISFHGYHSSQYITAVTIAVSINDTVVKTFTIDDIKQGGTGVTNNECKTQIDVNKGDVVSVTVVDFVNTHSSFDAKFYLNNLTLLANVDTPYKYVSLLSTTDTVSTQDVLNALLGV